MNNNELHDKILAEIRISELNTQKGVQEMLKPHDERIRALEDWRTYLIGAWAGVLALIGYKWGKS